MRGDPLSAHVRACAVVVVDRRMSRALHYIFGRYGSNMYFFLIIAHFQMKIYEVLKRASMHRAVVIHYSTGTTTNSASLVLKRVRISCARRCCCKVFSGRRCISSALLAHYSTGFTSLSMKGMQRRFCCKVFSGKQRRKNAVGFATEVVDSLLWVERHSGTVTGLPPKERLQERIHLSLQLLFCFPASTLNFLLLRHENRDRLPSFAVDLDEDPTDIFGAVCALLVFSALLKLQ